VGVDIFSGKGYNIDTDIMKVLTGRVRGPLLIREALSPAESRAKERIAEDHP